MDGAGKRSDSEFHPSDEAGKHQMTDERQGDVKGQAIYADDSSTSVTAPPTVSSAGPTVLSSGSSIVDVAHSSSSLSHVDESSSWSGIDPSSPWAARRRHLAGVLSTVVPGYGTEAPTRHPMDPTQSKRPDEEIEPVSYSSGGTDVDTTAEETVDDQVSSTNSPGVERRQRFSQSASNSFARLVQGWEATISSLGREARLPLPEEKGEKFEPLHLLEQWNLGCGQRDDYPTDEGVELYIDRLNWHPSTEATGFEQQSTVNLVDPDISHVRTAEADSICDTEDIHGEKNDARWMQLSPSMERSLSVHSEFRHSIASSAFSEPDHRRSYGAMSDPGVYNSAFEPVLSLASFPRSHSTIENGVDGTREKVVASVGVVSPLAQSTPPRELDHPKYLFVFNDGRRRRKKRSGRENPARPPSTSSSSRDTDDDSLRRGRGTSSWRGHLSDDGSSSLEAHLARGAFLAADGDETAISSQPSDELRMERRRHHLHLCSSNESDDGMSNEDCRDFSANSLFQYHPMKDDEEIAPIDEAAAAPLSPPLPHENPSPSAYGVGETSTPIPSVAYRPMTDCDTKEDVSPDGEAIARPNAQLILSRRNLVGLSPNSNDSGSVPLDTQSVNTSSHTQVTATTGTLSSAPTVSSVATEADNEVKDANRRKTRRRERSTTDSTESHFSESSSTTRPLMYFTSPGPLREGANLPVDRFFAGTVTQVSPLALESTLRNGASDGHSIRRSPPGVVASVPQSNVNSSEASSSQLSGNMSSPLAAEELPPLFSPSHLYRSPSRKENQHDGIAEERDSPAVIVGSTKLALEVRARAPSQHPKPIRPNLLRTTARVAQTEPAVRAVRHGTANGMTGRPTKRAASSEFLGSSQLSPEVNVSSASSVSSVGTPTSPPPQIIESRAPDDLQRMGAARPSVLRKHVDLKGASRNLVLVSPVSTDTSSPVAPIASKPSTWRRVLTNNVRPVTPENMGGTITSIEEEAGEIPMRPSARKDHVSSSRDSKFGPEMTWKGTVVTPEK